MSWSLVTTAEIAIDQPIKASTATKYKDDLDWLKTILSTEHNWSDSDSTIFYRTKLSLYDADCGHGVTDVAPTTIFGLLEPVSATSGGMSVWGLSDAADTTALQIFGIFGDTNPNDAVAAISVVAGKRSGTGRTSIADAETAFKLRNHTTDLITDRKSVV